MSNENATKVVATLTTDSNVIKSLAVLLDEAKRKEYRPLAGDQSVEYWVENFMFKAIHVYRVAMEGDFDRRMKEACHLAESQVIVPAPTAPPETWVAYGQKLASIRRRFRQGASQQEV